MVVFVEYLEGLAETGDIGADDCEISTIPPQSGLDGVKKTIISTNSYSRTVPRQFTQSYDLCGTLLC